MTRRVTIHTPLGEQLQFRKLEGTEALSDLFSLEVDLVSPSKNIDPKALLGKAASVVVETEGLGKRYLSGLVTHFGMRGAGSSLGFLPHASAALALGRHAQNRFQDFPAHDRAGHHHGSAREVRLPH
jgi:type VI secretion system secreted protein VgrG